MKHIKLFTIILALLIFSGCQRSIPKINDGDLATLPSSVSGESKNENDIETPQPNLSTEEDIKEYLVGEWLCKNEYLSNIVAKMNIDKDLNIKLSFNDSFTKESKGDYVGKINFDRIYAQQDEAPDIISIELIDSDYPGGDFFFLHRTIYEEKRVMSWFFAGNGDCIFNLLSGNDSEYLPEEIIFTKASGEISKEKPRKDDYFYAVFWGHGVEDASIWIDDVWWEPSEENDSTDGYPNAMTAYDNDKPGSVLYKIAPGKEFDILGNEMLAGHVYYVETDKKGNIIELMSAEYKRYIDSGYEDGTDAEIEGLISDILFNQCEETKKYLDDGMSILFTGETISIDGEDCYEVYLGTNHKEVFVKDIHYAVNINTWQVYRYNVLNDIWEPLTMG